MVAITGNTYPVRAELHALGGRWDKAAQAWMVPDHNAAAAAALAAGGLRKVGGRSRGYLGTDRSGCAHFSTPCRCEDYPCCGH